MTLGLRVCPDPSFALHAGSAHILLHQKKAGRFSPAFSMNVV